MADLDPRLYELAFRLKEESENDAARLRKLVEERKGLVVEEPKKTKASRMSFLKFLMRPEEIDEFRKALAAEKNILKYLVLKAPEVSEVSQTRRPPAKAPFARPPTDLESLDKKLEEILGK